MRGSNRMAGRRRGSVILSGLIAATFLALPVTSAPADQGSCGQVVRSSITLTNHLTACLGDGLVIGASGVTIDLNGHVIDGTGLGAGVRNSGHADVTIRNGTIRNFDHGVLLQSGTARNTVSGIAFEGTELAAVHLSDADGNQVRDSRATAFSGIGVHMTGGASLNYVGHNTFAAGNGEAVAVEGGSNFNRLEANTVTDSSDAAMRVEHSSNTTVIGNLVAGGSDAAITTTGAPRSVLQSNTVLSVGDAAIMVTDSTANVVRFNNLGQSADAGVIFSGVTDSLIKGNTMAQAGDAAIALRLGSSNIRVIDNQANNSSDAGVFMGDGVGNVVRGNQLLGNTIGVEVSGGRLNTVEFNVANASLGVGIEVGGSADHNVYGNTVSNNGTGGIVVDGGSLSGMVRGNQASGNGGDGIFIEGLGTGVASNLATNNHKWGIYAKEGVSDRGGNGARGNAEAAQCYVVICNDGHGWVAPVRPPEPLDPLEIGLEGGMAPPRKRSLRRAGGRKQRLAVVSCKQRRPRRARRSGRGRARAKTVCRASYKARRGSRRLAGRLVRDDRSLAGGKRRVKAGRRGMISMKARRRPRSGRYTLVLSFRDRRGKATVVRKPVRVR
jgi:parallel beta-helix repeat protein